MRTKSKCEILGSIVVSIPACHAGDRGSIPRQGDGWFLFGFNYLIFSNYLMKKYGDVPSHETP